MHFDRDPEAEASVDDSRDVLRDKSEDRYGKYKDDKRRKELVKW